MVRTRDSRFSRVEFALFSMHYMQPTSGRQNKGTSQLVLKKLIFVQDVHLCMPEGATKLKNNLTEREFDQRLIQIYWYTPALEMRLVLPLLDLFAIRWQIFLQLFSASSLLSSRNVEIVALNCEYFSQRGQYTREAIFL